MSKRNSRAAKAARRRERALRRWKPMTCRDFYAAVLDRLIAGGPRALRADDPWLERADPGGICRRWLSSEEHPLLAEQDGYVVALGDPVRQPFRKPLPAGSYAIDYRQDDGTCPRCGGPWGDGNHHRHEHRWVCRAPAGRHLQAVPTPGRRG